MIDWRKAYGFKNGRPATDLEAACPRCGGDCLLFTDIKDFTVPVEQAGFVAFGWSMCRALREPVLIGHQKPWWWVRVLRWQIAYIWKKQMQTVERLVPIYTNTHSWSEAANGGAAGSTYVVKFSQHAITPSMLPEKKTP